MANAEVGRSRNKKGWENWVSSALKAENFKGTPKGTEKMVPNSSPDVHSDAPQSEKTRETNTSW